MQKNYDIKGLLATFLNVLGIVCALTVVGVLSLTVEKPEVSEVEKRDLATFPEFTFESLFSGNYTEQLSMYFADTFPMRDTLVTVASDLKEGYGVSFNDIRIHNPDTPIAPSEVLPVIPTVRPTPPPQTSGDTSPTPSPTPEATPTPTADPNDKGSVAGALFIYQGAAYQIFGGSLAMGEVYADAINYYDDTLNYGDTDSVQVYNLIIPTAMEFGVPDELKEGISVSEKSRIDNVYTNLNPDIISVDAYSEIEAHSDEYLYFATDHHWTALGAYYAYTAFCESAGLTAIPLEDFETRRLEEDFYGSLYGQTNDSSLRDNPDYVEYYMIDTPHTVYRYDRNAPYYAAPHSLLGEYASGANMYSMFLHGDYPMVRIDTELNNGKKIVVVKESYGNAFAPFLVNHYEQVFVVDQRYFQTSLYDLITQNGVTDLLFINNSFAAHTSSFISMLPNLMYQVYTPPTPSPTPTTTESAVEGELPTDDKEDNDDEDDEDEENDGVIQIPG